MIINNDRVDNTGICHIERNEVESKYLKRIEISPRATLGRNDIEKLTYIPSF